MTPQKVSNAVLVGGLSLTTLAACLRAPVAVFLPGVLFSTAGAVYSGRTLKESSLGQIGGVVGELGLELLGFEADDDQEPLPAKKFVRPESVDAFLKGLVSQDVDPTTPDFWTPKRANMPALVVGPQGSGKTTLFDFRFRQCVAAGVKCFYADLHYDSDSDENGIGQKLPGVSNEDFRKHFLVKSADQCLKVLRSFKMEAEARLNGDKPSKEPWHFFIDEWEGYWARWTDEQKDDAIAAFIFIRQEARKAKVAVSASMKNIKEKTSGLDSQIVMGSDLYLMGNVLADKQIQIPGTIDRNARAKERAEMGLKIGCTQRAIVYMDYLSGVDQVVVSPDLLTPLQFELEAPKDDWEAWLESNRAKVDELRGQGLSLRKITEAMGITRSLSNPIYVGLQGYLGKDEEQAS